MLSVEYYNANCCSPPPYRQEMEEENRTPATYDNLMQELTKDFTSQFYIFKKYAETSEMRDQVIKPAFCQRGVLIRPPLEAENAFFEKYSSRYSCPYKISKLADKICFGQNKLQHFVFVSTQKNECNECNISGIIHFILSNEEVWVHDLYVKKKFRKQGIGALLLSLPLTLAECVGLPLALKSSADGAPFYQKLGFSFIGRPKDENMSPEDFSILVKSNPIYLDPRHPQDKTTWNRWLTQTLNRNM